jgi:hypothetical protein
MTNYAKYLQARDPSDIAVQKLTEEGAKNLVVVKLENNLLCNTLQKTLSALCNDDFYIIVDTMDNKAQTHIKFNNYADLEGITKNGILIVSDRAKIGDTLPPNLAVYDLRAKYTTSITTSVAHQDWGRVFGFRANPPVLLLSPLAASHFCGNTNNACPDKYISKKEPCMLTDNNEESSEGKIIEQESDQADTFIDPNYLFEDIYEMAKTHMLFTTKEAISDHIKRFRHIIVAEPQAGKTGTYLSFLFFKLAGILRLYWIPPGKKEAGESMEESLATASKGYSWTAMGRIWATGTPQDFMDVNDSELIKYHSGYTSDREHWKYNNQPGGHLFHLEEKIKFWCSCARQFKLSVKFGNLECGPEMHVRNIVNKQNINAIVCSVDRCALWINEDTYVKASLAELSFKHRDFNYLIFSLSLWDPSYLVQAYECLADSGRVIIYQSMADANILLKKDNLVSSQESITVDTWNNFLARYQFTIEYSEQLDISTEKGNFNMWYIECLPCRP